MQVSIVIVRSPQVTEVTAVTTGYIEVTSKLLYVKEQAVADPGVYKWGG